MPAAADFASFCATEHRRLVGALSLFLGDGHVAEELAQDALLKADQHWHRVRTMDRPGAWLVTVGMNLARSHLRRSYAARRAAQRLGEHPTVHHDTDVATQIVVRRAVAALPVRQREVIVLRYFVDLDVESTASALGITPSAVSSLAMRARRSLRADAGLTLTEEPADVR